MMSMKCTCCGGKKFRPGRVLFKVMGEHKADLWQKCFVCDDCETVYISEAMQHERDALCKRLTIKECQA